ncbi:hypothetical protein TCAL_17308 [Tigriopus californicus]|uniref:CCHC-type domain-containing protein n=1 Tax=Tigriopus californicus TaxID=6832 RepID=A0A553P0A0_TIGCA|nr:hypothetical protein TCAL_17308 [Tigriopus californicus]
MPFEELSDPRDTITGLIRSRRAFKGTVTRHKSKATSILHLYKKGDDPTQLELILKKWEEALDKYAKLDEVVLTDPMADDKDSDELDLGDHETQFLLFQTKIIGFRRDFNKSQEPTPSPPALDGDGNDGSTHRDLGLPNLTIHLPQTITEDIDLRAFLKWKPTKSGFPHAKPTSLPKISEVKKDRGTSSCFCCGGSRHPRRDCPAKEANCTSCGRKGHLSHLCRSISPKSSASIKIGTSRICSIGASTSLLPVKLDVENGSSCVVNAIPDTGAEISVMGLNMFLSSGLHIDLQWPIRNLITAVDGSVLRQTGSFIANVVVDGHVADDVSIVVCENVKDFYLDLKTCKDGIIFVFHLDESYGETSNFFDLTASTPATEPIHPPTNLSTLNLEEVSNHPKPQTV